MRKHNSFILLFVALLCFAASGQISVQKVRESVIDEQSLIFAAGTNTKYGRIINGVSFQQEALVTANGYQYCGYYNKERRVCIARRQLPDGAWKRIVLRDYAYTSTDAHNVISIGICPKDGTIHLSFDHHGTTLHYRVSKTKIALEPQKYSWVQGDTALFGPVRNYLETGKTVQQVTYPRFFQTPQGGLQIVYRVGGSGDGDSYIADYDPSTGAWKDTRCFVKRTGVYFDPDMQQSDSSCNAYFNGFHYDKNSRLHATWDWRNWSSYPNHDIDYAYSDDLGKTWKNSGGETVALYANGTSSKMITVESKGVCVWPLSMGYGQMNQLAQCADNQGLPHVVTYHRRTKGDPKTFASGADGPYFHYWRDNSGVWRQQEIKLARGCRPKLFADPADNLILVLQAGGTLYIYAATAAAGWADWKSVYSQAGSFGGELLGDPYRFINGDGILTVLCQTGPLTADQEEGRPLIAVDLAIDNTAVAKPANAKTGLIASNISVDSRSPGSLVRIRYTLNKTSPIRIGIYTSAGTEMQKLWNGVQNRGAHIVTWNGCTASGEMAGSGIYFVRFCADGMQAQCPAIKVMYLR